MTKKSVIVIVGKHYRTLEPFIVNIHEIGNIILDEIFKKYGSPDVGSRFEVKMEVEVNELF